MFTNNLLDWKEMSRKHYSSFISRKENWGYTVNNVNLILIIKVTNVYK